MATSYDEIINRAIFRINDSKLARLNEADQRFILQKYMDSAIADFQNKCDIDLSNRDNSDGFAEDLNNEVQEILALGISYYWLSAQILNSELLKNKLSTKDYSYFSPANLMRELQTLRETVRDEYKHRIINYTYDHGNISMEGAD